MTRTNQGFRVFNPGEIGLEELELLDGANPPVIPEQWKKDSLAFLKESLERV